MAHLFAKHAASRAGQNRAKAIMKANGGQVTGSDEAPLSTAGVNGRKLGASATGADVKVAGKKGAPKRYARGGKTKGHTINIIHVHPHPAMGGMPMPGPQGAPMAGAAPGMPPGGPPPGAGLPPGMMPPQGMPGQPMRARGGRTPSAGAATGVGREQKANIIRRHRGA